MTRRRRPWTACALAVPLVTLMLVSAGCTSTDERGEETVYEVVDPTAGTGPSPKPTIDVPGFAAPGPTDPTLVTLLAMGDRTGPATGWRLVSRSTAAQDPNEACTPNGACGFVGTLTISARCSGDGRLSVDIGGERAVDMACDSLLDITTSYLEWPRGEANASVTVNASTSTRWAMRVEQLVEPGI